MVNQPDAAAFAASARFLQSAPPPTACADRRLPLFVLLSDSSGILNPCST